MDTPLTKLSSKILQSDAFKSRFYNAQVAIAKNRLDLEHNLAIEPDISKLVLQASVLAMSEDIEHRKIAQKINALLYEGSSDNETVNYAVQILSSRIGNFPIIKINSDIFGEYSLASRDRISNDRGAHLNVDVLSELDIEEENSRISIRDSTYYLNLYQKEIYDVLAQKTLISFSAPTSFGKSFVVRNHIARRFAEGDLKRVLILVPTKSLIDDFYEAIVKLREEIGLNFGIYTHARSTEAIDGDCIFILTQERLSFLLDKNPTFVQSFQVIYCDEAQYISRGYRGFILQRTLAEVIRLCGVSGTTQYIFTSPLIKNPDYYHEKLFNNLLEDSCFHKEVIYSPVEKNIHFILKEEQVFKFQLLKDALNGESFNDSLEEVGTRGFPPNLQRSEKEDQIKRNSFIVLNSNIEGQTILYATSPMNAHQYAIELAQSIVDSIDIDNDVISDLGVYIKDHFDETFGLTDLVKKGIGLHYGKMPIGLRRAMVDLFEKGVVKYLICTSTLLEGVNLPAKNIFLFSNLHHGREKHTPLSFWNLIGRAGRMNYGLSGNIFCITSKIKEYQELFQNKESEIKPPDVEISENATKKSYVVRSFLNVQDEFGYVKSKTRSDIEFVIYELLTSDDIAPIIGRFRLSRDELVEFTSSVVNARNRLALERDILMRNPGIDPRLQENLLKLLKELDSRELINLFEIARNPLSANQLSIQMLLTKTEKGLYWPSQNGQSESISRRISQWLHENSISQFIGQLLRHHSDKTQIEKIEMALGVMTTLDTEISYNAPKYLKCLYDIAIYEADQRGINGIEVFESKIEAFLFAIESGVSSPIGKFLFEKGLSRPIAIKASSILVEHTNESISDSFFQNSRIREKLKAKLSRTAYNELIEHLA